MTPDASGADPFVAQLKALCIAAPTRAKWVCVPTHAIGRMLGDRLVLEGADWANLRFVTPLDIALRMGAPFLVERGIDPSEDGLGPALIMRLLLELPTAPSYFRPLANHPAMAQALWATIRELRMAGVGPGALVAEAFTSQAKHTEMQALYRAYEVFLATHARGDMATVYEEALRHQDWCPIQAQDCWVELPGAIWTPLQRRLLDALPGERVVPRLLDVPGAAIPRRLTGAKVERVAPDGTAPMAFLLAPEKAGPEGSALHSQPRATQIQLFHAGGREAEVEEVFRRILASGCSLDQVEIACASDDYAALVWEKACRYEWPVTLASGIPAALTRPGRVLASFGAWVESDFAAGLLRRLLESGDVTLGEVDLAPGQAARILVKAEAAWGRQTYELALGRLARRYRALAGDGDLAEDERTAAATKAEQANQLLVWIRALLATVPEGKRIDLQQLVDGVTAFVEEHAATRNALDAAAAVALTGAIAELRALGPFECTADAGLRFISERVSGLHVGADRSRPGKLHVSRLQESGYSGRRHVFVVGLEEGRVFPPATEDPVLLDVERARISHSLRRSSDRTEESVYAVVRRLATISGASSVCMSYSCRDLREFRQTHPSWLMLQAHRLVCGKAADSYHELRKALGTPASQVPEPATSALGLAGWWLNGLKRAGVHGRDDVLRQYPSLAHGLAAEAHRESPRFTEFDGHVPAAGSALDPCAHDTPVSPTQLESAARCPFRHFLQRGLGLTTLDDGARDGDVWLDPRTRGLLLHDLYAQLMRRSRDERRRLSVDADLAWAHEVGGEALDELRAEMPPPSDEVFERERQELLGDLELFVTAESEADEARKPIALEVSFGRAGDGEEPLATAEPVVIDLGQDLKFRLVGRIDRIDQIDASAFEVIDYKTGGYWPDDWKGTFGGGRMLQHALYGLAAVEILKKRAPGPKVTRGTYYFPSAKGRQERKAINTPSLAATTAVLSDLREVIASGLFVHAHEKSACKWCEFGNACGSNPLERAKPKIEGDPALDPFRRLEAHD